MWGVKNQVTLIANYTQRTMKFYRNASSFKELYAYANGGIWVEQDLNSTSGNLALTFYYGNLNLSQHVDLIANGGDLQLTSYGSAFTAVPLFDNDNSQWTIVDEPTVSSSWSMTHNIIRESSDSGAGNTDDCAADQFGT